MVWTTSIVKIKGDILYDPWVAESFNKAKQITHVIQKISERWVIICSVFNSEGGEILNWRKIAFPGFVLIYSHTILFRPLQEPSLLYLMAALIFK